MPHKDPERKRQYMAQYSKERWQQQKANGTVPPRDAEKDNAYRRERYRRLKAEGLLPKNLERSQAYAKERYARTRDKQIAAVIEWRKNNPEQAKAIHRACYNRHKDEINAKRREEHDAEYHKQSEAKRRERMATDPALRERRLESGRRSYERRREQCIQKTREWAAAHPDQVRQYTRTTNFKRRQAVGTHTTAQWIARFEFYGCRCAYCECPLTLGEAHCDHIIPLNKGGLNWASNLAPACKTCNLRKHIKSWLPLRLMTQELPPRIVTKES
jgi:5-methylcytosine-specific restriction endonuclease McrA